MEREGNDRVVGEKSLQSAILDCETSALSSTLLLDRVGEVSLTFNSDGLVWELANPLETEGSTCLGIKYDSTVASQIKLSEIYAVELADYGLIHISNIPCATQCLPLGLEIKMYRFTVHSFLRSKSQPSRWILSAYTFGHKNLQICQMWVNQINASLNLDVGRPRNLLVFVHPRSGKGTGCRTWEAVAPIFSHAKVGTKVIVTERAGQAFDVMSSITNKELNSYDGVVAVGGDGFFNEILNGFLSPRLKAPNPSIPTDFVDSVKDNGNSLVIDYNETMNDIVKESEEQFPLIPSLEQSRSGLLYSGT